ncbi:MAG: methylmalonyl Co-A mutase-associated GTPase MeaB [Pseudomonadota bacterium]
MTTGAQHLAAVREGGKPAVAHTLSRIEADRHADDVVALLDAAFADPVGHVIGLTGPPGVGKSTLTSALIQAERADGRTVAVLAIDPSSQITGGALLGDRTRLKNDPGDTGVFVRSMAARDRLGGLSEHAFAAAILFQALYDTVVVESVGVGQSEGDITLVSDTTLLAIQPGSGDSLQFMKAGIMELPDIIAVTKADMGAAARRAVADVEGALSLAMAATPVHLVSANTGEGLDRLVSSLKSRSDGGHHQQRRRRARAWVNQALRHSFGTFGADRSVALQKVAVHGDPSRTPFHTEKAHALALTLVFQSGPQP